MKLLPLATMILTLALAGCATFVKGTEQPVALTTNAPDATCSIMQNGEEVLPPSAVPQTFTLRSQPGNLLVTCTAPGYETRTVALVSGKDPLTITGHMWNSLLLGLVDVATGAVNTYQNYAYIPLQKL